jgi:hypothetical protein
MSLPTAKPTPRIADDLTRLMTVKAAAAGSDRSAPAGDAGEPNLRELTLACGQLTALAGTVEFDAVSLRSPRPGIGFLLTLLRKALHPLTVAPFRDLLKQVGRFQQESAALLGRMIRRSTAAEMRLRREIAELRQLLVECRAEIAELRAARGGDAPAAPVSKDHSL